MSNQQIPPAPKTQEELQAWVNELEKPVQMKTLVEVKLAAKKSACLMGVRQMVAMNADPELFWMAIGDLWKTYHKG